MKYAINLSYRKRRDGSRGAIKQYIECSQALSSVDLKRALTIRPLRVKTRKTSPATSALLMTISVCANAVMKNLATAWISTRSGMLDKTLETDTVEAMMAEDATKTTKGTANRRRRNMVRTFFMTSLPSPLFEILFSNVIPIVLIRYISANLSQ